MTGRSLALMLFTLAAVLSQAQPSLPSSFQAKTIHSPEGADIFVRWGGTGPVVLLIHGYAENSDSWAPLAADLMKDHTVVVPDLRGIGRSSKPADGYDKKTQAKDMRAVVTSLGYETVISGTWQIGYGDKFDEAKLKALPPSSFYTEPSARNHFAETGDEPVVVQITGFGPSSTEYVDATQDPRKSGKSL
jgi:hypothetical protein